MKPVFEKRRSHGTDVATNIKTTLAFLYKPGNMFFNHPTPLTGLDPRFKNLHFKDAQACAKIISFLRKKVKAATTDAARSASSWDEKKTSDYDFWEIHKELVHGKRSQRKDESDDELSRYLNNPTSPLKISIILLQMYYNCPAQL